MTGAKQRKKTSCCQDGDSNCAHNAYSFFIIVNGHGDGEGKREKMYYYHIMGESAFPPTKSEDFYEKPYQKVRV